MPFSSAVCVSLWCVVLLHRPLLSGAQVMGLKFPLISLPFRDLFNEVHSLQAEAATQQVGRRWYCQIASNKRVV